MQELVDKKQKQQPRRVPSILAGRTSNSKMIIQHRAATVTGDLPLQCKLNSLYIDTDKLDSRQIQAHEVHRSKWLVEKRQTPSVLLLI